MGTCIFSISTDKLWWLSGTLETAATTRQCFTPLPVLSVTDSWPARMLDHVTCK